MASRDFESIGHIRPPLRARAGKSKLIASFMLEGWSNDKIYNHINDNKLDQQYSNPVIMENIYQVRTRFKQKGITDQMQERQERQEQQVAKLEEELRERLKYMNPPRFCTILGYRKKLWIPKGSLFTSFRQ